MNALAWFFQNMPDANRMILELISNLQSAQGDLSGIVADIEKTKNPAKLFADLLGLELDDPVVAEWVKNKDKLGKILKNIGYGLEGADILMEFLANPESGDAMKAMDALIGILSLSKSIVEDHSGLLKLLGKYNPVSACGSYFVEFVTAINKFMKEIKAGAVEQNIHQIELGQPPRNRGVPFGPRWLGPPISLLKNSLTRVIF